MNEVPPHFGKWRNSVEEFNEVLENYIKFINHTGTMPIVSETTGAPYVLGFNQIGKKYEPVKVCTLK